MKITAQDFHARFAPSKCDLRVYLRATGEPEAEPGEFEQVLFRLGQRYEANHLSSFSQVTNLKTVSYDARAQATVESVAAEEAILYQPTLKFALTVEGVHCDCVGEPDFLIRENGWYVIRDVKMARRVDAENHPEIVFQLQFYGWLFKEVFGKPPLRLEVLNGKGEIVVIPDDGGVVMLVQMREILRLKELAEPPYVPVGWTKCNACGFRGYCWPKAEAAKDVALGYDIDGGLAMQLHEEGVENIGELLDQFTPAALSELKRPWGEKTQKVGKKADMILRRARVLQSGQEAVNAACR